MTITIPLEKETITEAILVMRNTDSLVDIATVQAAAHMITNAVQITKNL